MIGNPNGEREDSSFEGIFHHYDILYVMKESIEHDNEDGAKST